MGSTMDYEELYAKTYSEKGSAAIRRREQQWEAQDVLRTLKRDSLRYYEQQSWHKLSEINAERRKLAWRRQEMRWRDQDTIRLMHRLQKRKEDTLHGLVRVDRSGSAPIYLDCQLDRLVSDPISLDCQPIRESDISILCQA